MRKCMRCAFCVTNTEENEEIVDEGYSESIDVGLYWHYFDKLVLQY